MIWYGSDLWKLRGVDSLARLMRESREENVFAYRWDLDNLRDLGFIDLQTLLGAAHAMEVPFCIWHLDKFDANLSQRLDDRRNRGGLS
jgi:hypothetical protein